MEIHPDIKSTYEKIMAKKLDKSLFALKECALKLGIEMNSLDVVTPFTLLRALKEKVFSESSEPVPFTELENKALVFKINYAHHFGISKEDLDHLFDKYHRGENAPLHKPDGNGLGLYIAKGIIDKARGRMWAESIESVGTKVCFTLPKVG